jgi:hypothetical protein
MSERSECCFLDDGVHYWHCKNAPLKTKFLGWLNYGDGLLYLYIVAFILGLCALWLLVEATNAKTCAAIGERMGKGHDLVWGNCMIEWRPGEWVPLTAIKVQ